MSKNFAKCPGCTGYLRAIDRVGSTEIAYTCSKSGVVWCLSFITGKWTKISKDKTCEAEEDGYTPPIQQPPLEEL